MLFSGGPRLFGGSYEFTRTQGTNEWNVRIGRNYMHTDATGKGRAVRRNADGQIVKDEAIRTRFDSDGHHARAGWSGLVGESSVEASVGYANSNFENHQRLESEAGRRTFTAENNSNSMDFAVRQDRPFGNFAMMENRLLQEFSRADALNASSIYGTDQLFSSTRDSGETIARSNMRWAPDGKFGVEGGLELVYNFLDATQTFFDDGEPVSLPLANTKVEETRGILSGQLLWRFSDSLRMQAGADLEYSVIEQSGDAEAKRSFLYPKPAARLTWVPSEGHQLQARIERDVGQLSFGDFAASTALSDGQIHGGNLGLKPEQRWISELSWERRFRNNGVANLAVRHDRITDAIDVIPLEDGLTAVGNIGDASLTRVAANIRLPVDDLGLNNAYIQLEGRYDRARLTDPTTGERRDQSHVRPFEGAVRFEHDIPKYDVTWRLTWLPYYRQPTYEPDQSRYFSLRNYLIASIEYRATERLEFHAELTRWNDFEIGRDVFADRNNRDINFTERQNINPRDFLRLRARYVF